MGKVFDVGLPFKEGYALTGEMPEDEKSDGQIYVINTKGESVLKFKPGWVPITEEIIDGKTIIKNANNIYCVLNLKGELTKLPASVSGVYDYSDGMIVFSREGELGVMNEDGEILIRPKYTALYIISSDRLLAQKSSDVWVMMNKKGEEIFSTDEYERMFQLGKSLIGKGKTTYNLLDEKGKLMSQDDFFEIGMSGATGNLINNYFNSGEVAEALVKAVEESLAKFKLGQNAAQILQGDEDAADSYGYTYEPEDMKKQGFRWTIAGRLYFSSYFSTYNPATSSRQLSNKAILKEEGFNVYVPEDYCADVFESLKKAFGVKGFKVAAPEKGVERDNIVTLMSAKNKICLSKHSDGRISISVTPAEMNPSQIGDQIDNPAVEDGLEDAESFDESQTSSGNASATMASLKSGDFGWLAQRAVTAADLNGLDKAQCRILRNAIFARHGYKFKSKDLADYFGQFSWYKPQYSDVNSQLSATERNNIDFIKSYE